jgi:hypothetical protein
MLANWPWHSIPWLVSSSPNSCILQGSILETSTPFKWRHFQAEISKTMGKMTPLPAAEPWHTLSAVTDPVLGYDNFRMASSDHASPLFDRRVILTLTSDQIEAWNSDHQARVSERHLAAAARRKSGDRRSKWHVGASLPLRLLPLCLWEGQLNSATRSVFRRRRSANAEFNALKLSAGLSTSGHNLIPYGRTT